MGWAFSGGVVLSWFAFNTCGGKDGDHLVEVMVSLSPSVLCCDLFSCPGAQQPIRLAGLFPRLSAEDFFNPLPQADKLHSEHSPIAPYCINVFYL